MTDISTLLSIIHQFIHTLILFKSDKIRKQNYKNRIIIYIMHFIHPVAHHFGTSGFQLSIPFGRSGLRLGGGGGTLLDSSMVGPLDDGVDTPVGVEDRDAGFLGTIGTGDEDDDKNSGFFGFKGADDDEVGFFEISGAEEEALGVLANGVFDLVGVPDDFGVRTVSRPGG